MRRNRVFLSIFNTRASPAARTVADRTSFSNTDISPKKLPASRKARCCSPPLPLRCRTSTLPGLNHVHAFTRIALADDLLAIA